MRAPVAGQQPSATGPSNLADLLLRSLEELAAAGNAETACRLAGHACLILRHIDPKTERRFNALLHRLTRHLTW